MKKYRFSKNKYLFSCSGSLILIFLLINQSFLVYGLASLELLTGDTSANIQWTDSSSKISYTGSRVRLASHYEPVADLPVSIGLVYDYPEVSDGDSQIEGGLIEFQVRSWRQVFFPRTSFYGSISAAFWGRYRIDLNDGDQNQRGYLDLWASGFRGSLGLIYYPLPIVNVLFEYLVAEDRLTTLGIHSMSEKGDVSNEMNKKYREGAVLTSTALFLGLQIRI